MSELVVMLAGAMPREIIVDRLEKAIKEWRQVTTEQNWKKIGAWCGLVISKQMMKNDGAQEDVDNQIKELQIHQRTKNLLKPDLM